MNERSQAAPSGAASAPPTRSRRDLALAALVGVVVTALALPFVGYGFVYDDGVLFADAPTRRTARELWALFGEAHWRHLPYWRPLARLTLEAGKLVHGRDAAGFHAVNAVLAGGVVAAAYLFLRRPLGVAARTAAALALLFMLHPVASSCTVPIAGRETLLATLFTLVAVGAWCSSGVAARLCTWLAFALALLSRETAVVVPALCLAADATRLSRWSATRHAPGAWLVRYAPLVALASAWWIVRTRVLDGAGGVELALAERPLGPLFSLGHVVASTFVPGTTLDYEPPLAIWARPGRLALAALAALCVGWRARSLVAFGLAWTFVALAPTANVLVQEARFAERHVFFPMFGLVIVLAACVEADLARGIGRRAWPVLIGAALVAAALSSALRAPTYRDDERFLARWVASNPDSAQAHLSYGCQLVKQGRAREGEAKLRRALELLPDYADAHANLGALLVARGDDAAGVPHLRQAVRLAPDVPHYHENLAAALLRRGNTEGALQQRRRVVALSPGSAPAWLRLGELLAVSGERAEARAAFLRALELEPGSDVARRRLADLGPP